MTAIEGSIVRAPGKSKPTVWLWLHEWAASVDHKKLGLMYIGSGLLFFLIGGLEASMMRAQLALPNNDLVGPETFNRLMTVHGTTMVFFVGMPIFFGFGNYLIPLMIGARDLAFPRLNAFGFWLFLFGGLLFYFSWIGGDGLYGMGTAPDVGWFAYSPLTAPAFAPGNSTDYWILGILVAGLGSTGTALNFVATIVCMRCPGMTYMKMPLFVWLMLVNGFLVLVALTPLTAAQVMLLFDRFLDSHFFPFPCPFAHLSSSVGLTVECIVSPVNAVGAGWGVGGQSEGESNLDLKARRQTHVFFLWEFETWDPDKSVFFSKSGEC